MSPVRKDNRPYIVAELSGNHDGSLAKALETVREVAKSGADAIKLQTYTPDTITMDVQNDHFRISKDHPLWGNAPLYELYEKAHTPWDWHAELFSTARALGLEIFSTPFDNSAVDFLEELDVSFYKIASIELSHLPLIRYVAQKKKPMIISTGAATLKEIAEALEAASSEGADDITLMVCTSSYPADPSDANIARIPALKKTFGVKVGLSDHTEGIGVSVAAAALGASMIEKHVTLSKGSQGVDADFSITVQDLRTLVTEVGRASESIGLPHIWNTENEAESRRLRPSIYVNEDVKAGAEVTESNIRIARPSGGIEPRYFSSLIGKQFTSDAKFGEPLQWNHLS